MILMAEPQFALIFPKSNKGCSSLFIHKEMQPLLTLHSCGYNSTAGTATIFCKSKVFFSPFSFSSVSEYNITKGFAQQTQHCTKLSYRCGWGEVIKPHFSPVWTLPIKNEKSDNSAGSQKGRVPNIWETMLARLVPKQGQCLPCSCRVCPLFLLHLHAPTLMMLLWGQGPPYAMAVGLALILGTWISVDAAEALGNQCPWYLPQS